MKHIEIINGKVKCPMLRKSVDVTEVCMEPCKYLCSRIMNIDITCRYKDAEKQ